MNPNIPTVVGIDVGGESKGFHVVALRERAFEIMTSADPEEIVRWCREKNARVVAVDAPCGWSDGGSSRQADRDLKMKGKKIQCYATTTREAALAHKKGFYGWVLNGERLYQALTPHYRLFDGKFRPGPTCFETFPHAITCAHFGKVIPAQPKLINRRKVLTERGYDPAPLPNLDFVDAALCALAAKEFVGRRMVAHGNRTEGFIVLPDWSAE